MSSFVQSIFHGRASSSSSNPPMPSLDALRTALTTPTLPPPADSDTPPSSPPNLTYDTATISTCMHDIKVLFFDDDDHHRETTASQTECASGLCEGMRVSELQRDFYSTQSAAQSLQQDSVAQKVTTHTPGMTSTSLAAETLREDLVAGTPPLPFPPDTESIQGVFPLLLPLLPDLPFECRKDIASVFGVLLRMDSGYFLDYVAANFTDIVPKLVLLHSLPSTALCCGSMVRECVRQPGLYKRLLNETACMWLFFDVYVHLPNFDVASDAFSTLRELLTRDRTIASAFLNAQYDKFLKKYEKLLSSTNYITRRLSLKLLGELLLDRSNFAVMMKYISSRDNLKTMMILLRDPSGNIQYEAFHVFKVFVANPRKPPEIIKILFQNKVKLVAYLKTLHVDREADDQFRDEKLLVISTLERLEGCHVMRGLGLCPNAMGAIGNTPLVKLSNINAALKLPHGSFIYAKLENLSVGGSKKDRVAKQIVGDALADGSLKAGQRIVELTSGNTGTGLAIVAAAMNHPFTAVMSKGNSPERARMMTALGADVVLVEQAAHSVPGQVSGEDLDLVEAVTRGIVKEGGAFRADQFALPGSYRAHYLNTGPEAWEQSGKCLDGFVDFVGSGGTFVGIAKYLKEQRGDEVKCFVVEPEEAAVLRGGGGGGGKHKVQGGGYMKNFDHLPLFSKSVSGVSVDSIVDGYLTISDSEAIETARLLACKEGIFGGFSGGANVAAAANIIRQGTGKHVLALVCDNGLKYLSTDLYE